MSEVEQAETWVRKRMVAHSMPLGGDHSGQARSSGNAFPNQKECRGGLKLTQLVENRRCHCRVWSVIECETDEPRPSAPAVGKRTLEEPLHQRRPAGKGGASRS